MAGCDPKTFNNISKEVFECLKGRLAEVGYTLEGNSGTIQGPMSITIDYAWTENDQSLFIHVKDKNFLVPCGKINSELEKAVERCIAATGGSMTA